LTCAAAFGNLRQPGVQVVDQRLHGRGMGTEGLGTGVELALQLGHAVSARVWVLWMRASSLNRRRKAARIID